MTDCRSGDVTMHFSPSLLERHERLYALLLKQPVDESEADPFAFTVPEIEDPEP